MWYANELSNDPRPARLPRRGSASSYSNICGALFREELRVNFRLMPMLACLAFAPAIYSSDFFPLRPGNTWTYRESTTGETFTVRVGTPVMTNGNVYYSLDGYVKARVLARLDDAGQLVYVDEDKNIERPLTPLAPMAQGWLEAPLRICEQESQAQEKPGYHDGAAGPFEHVLDLRYRSFGCADAGVESEQYAANVGMVRRQVTTIAGPRRFDLVYARVGQALIDASTNGAFSVSANLTPETELVPVTLRLNLNAPAGMTLSFPTGQEFELALLDPQGKTVWRWSDGMAFEQAGHTRSVSGAWSVQLAFPRSALAAASDSTASLYALQAWLTTAGGAPQFAASVPLAAPGVPTQSSRPRRR